MASGDAQVAALGTPLAQPLVALLTDGQQNPIVGATVTFRAVDGDGRFPNGSTEIEIVTDGSGLATVPFRLGSKEGWEAYRIEAGFPGRTSFPAVFLASGFPAGDPAATRISGVVLDNEDRPVPGVTLRLRDSAATALSDAAGRFTLAGVPPGQAFLIADASTTTRPGAWPNLEFELFAVAGLENSLPKPVYLLPLDLAHGVLVDETRGGRVTIPELPGFALDIAPGSVTFPGGSRSGMVSVTPVHADKIPMAPGSGMQPRLIVTIQPAGAHFDPPAALTLPNVDGLPPGTVTEMFSFDHDIGAFVSIGTGSVSEDGRVLRSDPGFGVGLAPCCRAAAPACGAATPDGRAAATSGPVPHPAGSAAGPCCRAAATSGPVSDPASGAAGPDGRAAAPTCRATALSGNACGPTGNAPLPNCHAAATPGPVPDPAGAAAPPDGRTAAPDGRAAALPGNGTGPAGNGLNPEGRAAATSEGGAWPSGDPTAPLCRAVAPHGQTVEAERGTSSPAGEARAPEAGEGRQAGRRPARGMEGESYLPDRRWTRSTSSSASRLCLVR